MDITPDQGRTAKTIVYACDDSYAGLAAVSVVSALKWNAGARIVLLGNALAPESVALVRTRVEGHGGDFVFLDLSDKISAVASRSVCPYTSYAAYSRLFIADLLPERFGRVLYLDCDTLVRGPLDALFALPLQGRPFGFGYDCIHAAYKRHVNVAPDAPYYNSGVMLADLKAWRASGATATLQAEIDRPHGPNPLGDQDLIVRAWRRFITPLDPKWNFLSQYFLFDYDCLRAIGGRAAPWASREAFADACRAPVVCHFSGHTLGRPWFTSSRHPMREAYRAAAAEAGLPQVAEQVRPMSFPYALQSGLHRLLPKALFQPIASAMLRTHVLLTYGLT